MNRFAFLSFIALAGSVFACAAPSVDSDESDSAADDSALTAKAQCSPADYNKGLAAYKVAVASAKAREKDSCEDNTMLSGINAQLQEAVRACGEFRNVISTSPWAAPVRKAFDGNLNLAVIEGRVTTSGTAVTSGLAKSLVGQTLYGPFRGAYGNTTRYELAANGKGAYLHLEFGEDGETSWKSTPITWSATDKTLTVTKEGVTTSYAVTAETFEHSVWEIKFTPASGDAFESMPSECEA